jgi:hypothetical protein
MSVAEEYRRQAACMSRHVDGAASPEVAAAYAELARQWELLARHSEAFAASSDRLSTDLARDQVSS